MDENDVKWENSDLNQGKHVSIHWIAKKHHL